MSGETYVSVGGEPTQELLDALKPLRDLMIKAAQDDAALRKHGHISLAYVGLGPFPIEHFNRLADALDVPRVEIP